MPIISQNGRPSPSAFSYMLSKIALQLEPSDENFNLSSDFLKQKQNFFLEIKLLHLLVHTSIPKFLLYLCPLSNKSWPNKKKVQTYSYFWRKKIRTFSRSSPIRITKHPPRSKEKNAFLIRFTFEYYFSIIRYLTLIVLSIQIRFFWLLYVFHHEKEGVFFSSTPSSCTKHLYSIRNFEGLRTTYISIDLH